MAVRLLAEMGAKRNGVSPRPEWLLLALTGEPCSQVAAVSSIALDGGFGDLSTFNPLLPEVLTPLSRFVALAEI